MCFSSIHLSRSNLVDIRDILVDLATHQASLAILLLPEAIHRPPVLHRVQATHQPQALVAIHQPRVLEVIHQLQALKAIHRPQVLHRAQAIRQHQALEAIHQPRVLEVTHQLQALEATHQRRLLEAIPLQVLVIRQPLGQAAIHHQGQLGTHLLRLAIHQQLLPEVIHLPVDTNKHRGLEATHQPAAAWLTHSHRLVDMQEHFQEALAIKHSLHHQVPFLLHRRFVSRVRLLLMTAAVGVSIMLKLSLVDLRYDTIEE